MKLYLKAILGSFILHACLFSLLFFKPTEQAKHYVLKQAKQPVNIVKSVSIDELKVDEEIKRIQTRRIKKRQDEQAYQKRLAKRAADLRKQRMAEQKRIKALKQETEALKEAQIKQAKKQAEQISKEKKKLAALKRKRALAKKEMLKEKKAYDALQEKRLQAKKEKEARLKLAKQKEAIKKQEEAKRLAEMQEALHKEALEEAKAQQMAGLVNRYKALIINAISQHWIVPPDSDQSLSCRFEIHLADNGVVQRVRLLRSSGDPVLDRSAKTAIYRASPLPVPKTPDAFALFKVVSLTVKPEGLIS